MPTSRVRRARGDVPEVADIRRRQAAGEIAADLDPGFPPLALMGAVAAGVTMPHMAERVGGVDPATPEFLERYADQLRRSSPTSPDAACEPGLGDRAAHYDDPRGRPGDEHRVAHP